MPPCSANLIPEIQLREGSKQFVMVLGSHFFMRCLWRQAHRMIYKPAANGKMAVIVAGKIVEVAQSGKMAADHPGTRAEGLHLYVITGGTVDGGIIITEEVL